MMLDCQTDAVQTLIATVVRTIPVRNDRLGFDLWQELIVSAILIALGGAWIFRAFRQKEQPSPDAEPTEQSLSKAAVISAIGGLLVLSFGLFKGWQAFEMQSAGPVNIQLPPLRTLPPHPIMGVWEENPRYALELRNDGMMYAHDHDQPVVVCLGSYQILDDGIELNYEEHDFGKAPRKLEPGQTIKMDTRRWTEKYRYVLEADQLTLTDIAGKTREFKRRKG